MGDWKTKIENLVEEIDELSDRVRVRWRTFKGYDEPLAIIPYLGFGTNTKLYLNGRVIEDKGAIVSSETDGRRRNLANLYRRFSTDEVPHARVRAMFRDFEKEVVCDGEGYFKLEFELPASVVSENDFSSPLREIELELLEPITRANHETPRAVGQILVPPASANFGVISDLDDTVITTNVTSRLKMLLTVALLNEYTRLPFKGVSAFYEALQKGAGGSENNPIFYVSSSPWNLYPFLVEFLRIHKVPLGTLFLKDFGNHTIFNSGDHATHKTKSIEMILDTYPQMTFVLIGDSGESDPEIYREIVKKYPNRIRAIYIRSINNKPERLAAIDKLIAEIAETGCQLVLAPDTEFAAVHAAAEKLIATEALADIRGEKREDEATPRVQELIEKNPEI